MWGRIVVAGTLLQHAIVPDSAAPFDFQAAYGLSSPYVLQLYWGFRLSVVCSDLREPIKKYCVPTARFPTDPGHQRPLPGGGDAEEGLM